MTRLTLRKGLTLQAAPGGVGHLTDTRTGDALVLSPYDFQLLAAGKELDSTDPELAAVLLRYGPFYVETKSASFYELDIEDAPTVPQIPSIAPVTIERPVPVPDPETKEHAAFAPPDEDFTQPAGLAVTPAPEPVARVEASTDPASPAAPLEPAPVTREESLQQALEPQHTEQVSPADVQAAIVSAAAMAAPGPWSDATLSGATSNPAPEVAAAPRSSKRPLVLALGGVTLLAVAVAATFALRPKGETQLPEVPTVVTPVTTVVDAGAPPLIIDAGRPGAIDAGIAAPRLPEPVIDAGVAVAAAEVDAGAAEEPGTEWLTAEVQARGRVKMGEVTAPLEGEVIWTVADEERVKAKQPIGGVAPDSGEPKQFAAPSVGLVMIKQPADAKVKRGQVVAEIIYFEAWARAAVKGKAPKTSWRCEVSSAALQQKAACKISVVAAKAGGAVVTVAVEPRWFDGATDAVLRFTP